MIRRKLAALAACAILSAAWAAEPESRTFTVAFSSGEIEFNPQHSIYTHEAQLFTALYEGLFSYDPSNLDPVKSAASRYTRSQDGKTYTFYLRKEARWSDGAPLVAAHFRDAWLRMIDPKTKADYAAFFDVIAGARDFRTGKTADAGKVGISVIADDVLQVRLESPAPYFTRLLCHHSFAPVHPSRLGVRDWSSAPETIQTNGPYKVASYDGKELILVRNERYWDDASVKVDRIRALFIDDDKEATSRYNGGEIDWLAGGIDVGGLLNPRALQVNPMFATNYWYFDCSKAPWSDKRVRTALQLLAPWDKVRDKTLYQTPARELVLKLQGYKGGKSVDKRDVDAAKALLAEAGFPEGAGLPPAVILIPDGEDSRRISGLLKEAWAEAGVKADIQAIPPARFYTSAKDREFAVSITSWIGDFADPMAFLQMWTADSNLNGAKYADKAYDDLIARSMTETGETRLDTLSKAEQLLLDSGAVMPIYHQLAVNVVDTDAFPGWYRNALDIHPFKYVEFGVAREIPDVVKAY